MDWHPLTEKNIIQLEREREREREQFYCKIPAESVRLPPLREDKSLPRRGHYVSLVRCAPRGLGPSLLPRRRAGMKEESLTRLVQSFAVSHITYVAAFHNWRPRERNKIDATICKAYKVALGLLGSTSTEKFMALGINLRAYIKNILVLFGLRNRQTSASALLRTVNLESLKLRRYRERI